MWEGLMVNLAATIRCFLPLQLPIEREAQSGSWAGVGWGLAREVASPGEAQKGQSSGSPGEGSTQSTEGSKRHNCTKKSRRLQPVPERRTGKLSPPLQPAQDQAPSDQPPAVQSSRTGARGKLPSQAGVRRALFRCQSTMAGMQWQTVPKPPGSLQPLGLMVANSPGTVSGLTQPSASRFFKGVFRARHHKPKAEKTVRQSRSAPCRGNDFYVLRRSLGVQKGRSGI